MTLITKATILLLTVSVLIIASWANRLEKDNDQLFERVSRLEREMANEKNKS